ncbi:MAG: hypothetical protein DHS20C14_09060 [Phycisphaeraceae bacterium]|nr:MAG: hypothetical protein DHS20C14_09060 [Phycisphaeraceae bacterium]
MSLPSQVGRTPGRGPKVESRSEPRFGKNQVLYGAVGGGVVLAVLVIAIVATRGGSGDAGQTVAGITDPLAQIGGGADDAATTGTGTAAAGADPALDLVMGGGTPTPAEPDTRTPGEDTVAGGAVDTDEPDDDFAIDAVLNQPERAPTKGILTDVFEAEGATGTGSAPVASGGQPGGDNTEPHDTPPATHASADGELATLPEAGTLEGEALARAGELRRAGRLLAARDELNLTLSDDALSERGRERVRAEVMDLNQTLVFSAHLEPGDDMASEYRVQSGDSLARIARAQSLGTHWKLIARVNGIDNPSRINVGQRLKLVRGPFHAVVDKSDFRLDVYHGAAASPREWVYVTSLPVGLGADDGTPVGTFVVSEGKLENPGWVNPRDSSERYDRNDPANPIGEYWVGLEGQGDAAAHTGYGLHGTTDPGSIGKTMSMGCVRLGDDDAALMYELLTEGVSVVHIVP